MVTCGSCKRRASKDDCKDCPNCGKVCYGCWVKVEPAVLTETTNGYGERLMGNKTTCRRCNAVIGEYHIITGGMNGEEFIKSLVINQTSPRTFRMFQGGA